MDSMQVAQAVLDALGGRENILTNAVCMTRLRVTLADVKKVDYERLGDVSSVLGTATRGSNGVEVVFGPRVIDGIYHSFVELTGIAARPDDLFPMSRPASNMHVQIRTGKPRPQPSFTPSTSSHFDEQDMSVLEGLFSKEDEDNAKEAPVELGRLLVINGPNLNMLGVAVDSVHFKEADYISLLELCKHTAEDCGFTRCDCFQSNHEGDLVDAIQDSLFGYDAIVINPGAYGSSKALRDALRSVTLPAVEVHLHRLDEEDAVGITCLDSVCGHGMDGYAMAIEKLAKRLSER